MTHDRLTCVVPTHNRPHFLRRLLHFYSQFPPGFPFLIVDSSNLVAAAENREVVQGVHGKLDIDYQHFDLNIMDKCVQGLARVRSPFVVFCADDDYLFSNAVWRCVEFLENEPGYLSAMGRIAQLSPKLPRWCCMVHQGYSIEDDRPFDRCFRIADSWFSNFYAVHRTEVLRDIFQITAANTDSRQTLHVGEMLLSQLSLLRGRVKIFRLMYTIMEIHDTNSGKVTRTGVLPQAELLYQRFRGCLTEQFEQSGINRADAERFIDESYGYFRDPNVASRRRRRSVGKQIRRLVGKITALMLDRLWTNYRGRSVIKRLLRSSDLAGCELTWRAAVQLMCDFPQGIPSDHSTLERGA